MADLFLTLSYDDAPGRPKLGSCGAELYEAMEPLAHDDHANGWALAHLCEALGRMRQPISDLVRAWEEGGVPANAGDTGTRVTVTMPRSGWSRAAHPRHAPHAPGRSAQGSVDLLPFVGQLVGVRGIEQLGEDDRRDAIRERDGFWRGQHDAILSFARRYLTAETGVTLRERYNPSLGVGVDAPYHGRIIIKRSRVRDLARVNLAHNPRAQVDTTGLTVAVTGPLTNASLAREACTWHPGVGFCIRVAGRQPGSTAESRLQLKIGDAGAAALQVEERKRYTASAYLRVADPSVAATSAGGIRWAVQWYNAVGAPLTSEAGTAIADEVSPDTRLSSTFVAPDGAVYAQFRIEQATTTASDELAFEATAILLEQTDQLLEFGDADTVGWAPRGPRYRSPARGPGIDAPDLAASVLARIPAGLIYDVLITDDLDWTEVYETWRTWDEVEAANTTWDAVLVPDTEES